MTGCTPIIVPGSPTPTGLAPELFTQVVRTLTASVLTSTPSPPPPAAEQIPTLTPSLPPPPVGVEASPTAQPTSSPTSQATNPPTALPVEASPSPSPTARATPVPGSAPPPPSSAVDGLETCQDKAAYYGDVTVPDDTLLAMNFDFVKTWKIRNAGTCSWGTGYLLVFAGGSPLNGPQSSPLPAAAPGEIIQVSVSLRTPAQGGTYISDWVFQNPAGKRFGVNSGGQDMIWAKIRVDWGPGLKPAAAPLNCAYESDAAIETQLLGSINAVRSARGLKPLTLQSQLSAAALAHSADMACQNFVDHTGSDGSNWFNRIKAAGYSYSYASENIYVGDPKFGGDANGAFTWWMNSQVHRDNILSDKISQIGIGYAFFSKSKYGGYYTLNFGRP